ncbi:MAG TPA: phosphotransferase [Anaerolineales bacterium]|nr:phosphotransferase [Anaerolineales bacterium]
MDPTLDKVIARIPDWAQDPELRATPLGGGITNRNFRIDHRGQSYVLRLAGEGTELLGIDRDAEYAATRAAASVGVGPEVVHFLRPEGYLVTRFIDGRPIDEGEIGRPEMIRRVVEALHKIHALGPIPGRFSAFDVVRTYVDRAREHRAAFPSGFADLQTALDVVEAHLPPFPLRPCHNDLLNANFLDDGAIRILDWEYAGMGDVFFDLGNFSRNHSFDEDQDRCLLEAYFGPTASGRMARLKLMRVASDMREAMWGLLQSTVSTLDFDFRGYAEKHFQRAAEAIGDSDWKTWIEEAAHGT